MHQKKPELYDPQSSQRPKRLTLKDMTGAEIRNVRVVSRGPNNNQGAAMWNVACRDCDSRFTMHGYQLRGERLRPFKICPRCFPGYAEGQRQRSVRAAFLQPMRPRTSRHTCWTCGSQPWRVEGERCAQCKLEHGKQPAIERPSPWRNSSLATAEDYAERRMWE